MSITSALAQVTLGVCLQLAATAETTPQEEPVFVPVRAFTLAWVHSIEKVRWEEDYEVIISHQSQHALKADFGENKSSRATSTQPVLLAKAARIKGSAAGMEPPEGAILKDGWYHYTPAIAEHQEIRLTRSEFVPDYEWCDQKGCRSLATILPSDGGVTLMRACEKPE